MTSSGLTSTDSENEKKIVNIIRTCDLCGGIQARIVHLVAYRLVTGEVLVSNPGRARIFQ